MKGVVSAMPLVLCVLLVSGLARAQEQEEVLVKPVDIYISGFGGYSFPFKTDFSFGGTTLLTDVDLENSPSFGGKIGTWITAPRKNLGIDVGVEFDVTHFNPNPQGTLELSATYLGINVLARVPMGVSSELPNGRWFPYVGVGGGGQRLTMTIPGLDDGRSTAPAFQGLGGVKVFVTRHIAIFAEGKFLYASHNQKFEGTSATLDLDLMSVHGVGGLSFHF